MLVNNKKIIKNTAFLYFRMIIVLAVSLYTTRIVLDILGVVDFGIYNVVASFVIMFGFLNSALTSATQRFLSFELGKVGPSDLNKVFSLSLISHVILALFILVMAESVGLWFLNNKINIPLDRINAAFWVFQFAILNIVIVIVRVPYDAMIIAHEDMIFFAYMSIFEAVFKLMAVYLLIVVTADKLIAYSVFVFLVSTIVLGFYYIYSKKHYKEARFIFAWHRVLAKEMFSFSGWSLFGGLAWMLMNHGINIMLNILFGPSVNAARGISMQVNSAIVLFITSFRSAVNPQIIKMYSAENHSEMKNLSLLSARYTFYLALILILPLYLEIDTVLNLWLVAVPEWTVTFCELILIFSLIQTFDLSFGIVFQAAGKIKENQLWGGVTYLLVLPVAYILTNYYNLDPRTVYYVQIVGAILVSFVVKVVLLNKVASIPFSSYWLNFLKKTMLVFIPVLIVSFLIKRWSVNPFVDIFIICMVIIISVMSLDMDRDMRSKIFLAIRSKFCRG